MGSKNLENMSERLRIISVLQNSDTALHLKLDFFKGNFACLAQPKNITENLSV